MRRSNIIALVVFLVAVGFVLALNPRNTIKIQSGFLGIVAPFFKTGSSLQLRVAAYREGLKSLVKLEQENKLLVVKNRELAQKIDLLKGLEEENNRLRRAIGYEERSVFQLIPARIIARDSGSWWSTVKIDRGFDDGVDSDMPVLTEDGLVGKTTTVAKNFSTVLLMADETCKVSATSQCRSDSLGFPELEAPYSCTQTVFLERTACASKRKRSRKMASVPTYSFPVRERMRTPLIHQNICEC